MRKNLDERIYSLSLYLDHRERQQIELRGIQDWQVRVLLWCRRVVQKSVFRFWLAELKFRRSRGLP